MRNRLVLTGIFLIFLAGQPAIYASGLPSIKITLQKPTGRMKMGDTPSFTGIVKNTGKAPAKGLIVCLSLVSLKKGNERPLDLEDWSANRAVRINKLMPGEVNEQKWKMRLIKSGSYGVLLTVIDPKEKHPIVSDLTRFTVSPKPMIESSRVKTVAVGVPLLIVILFLLFGIVKSRTNKV